MRESPWNIVIVDPSAVDCAATEQLLAGIPGLAVGSAATIAALGARAGEIDCLILSGALATCEALAQLTGGFPGRPRRPATVVVTAAPLAAEEIPGFLQAGADELLSRCTLTPAALHQAIATAIARTAVAVPAAGEPAAGEPADLNESILRSFYSSSELMMGVVELLDDDSDIVHLYSNPATCGFLGVRYDGKPAPPATTRLPDQETLRLWIRHYRASEESGAPVRFEYRHPGATPLWLASIVAHVGKSPNGRSRFSYVTDDITSRKLADERRREDEKRLALTLQAGKLGFWDVHIPTGKTVFGGDWAKMLGYADEEVAPHISSWEKLLHPDEAAEVLAKVAEHFAGESEFYEAEHRLRHKDGSWRWILDRGQVVERDANGQSVRALGTHADVTPRRLAEERLRESEERFRLLVEASSLAVWECAPDGTPTTESPSWIALTGQTLADRLKEDGWAKAVHPDDRLAAAAKWEVAVATGTVLSSEFRLRRADGSWQWTRTIAAPLRNHDGSIAKWFGMNLDINERKQSEDLLRESESFYRQTLESIPGMTFTCTPDGYCDFISQQWVEFTGVPNEEQLGSGWTKLLHPDDRQRTADAWLAAVENRGSYDLEYRVRSHAGNYEWFKVRSRAIRDSSGEIVRWFGAAVNVDDLVRAKTALREADQRKDEFLAMLAHELRNPLAPILSAVEILRLTRGTDHDPATFHDVIERQVQHLTLLVDDLLDVSRVSTGKIQLQNAPFDLVSAAEQAVEIHQPFINDRQHQLTVVLAAEPISIVGDSGRISQVIGNLLNNAAKYSEPGSAIHLIVDSDTTTSPPTAVVRVRDDGRGIDPAAIPHLFDLFFQDGRTLDRAEGGLGLGLSLVKSLVHLHGGSVDVHSAGRGHGAEFTVRLPLAPADAPALPPLPPVTQAPAPSAPKCILVVDDNVHLADSMTELLRLTGHDVHTARDGQQAVDLAVDLRPDVILMDIGLPKLNGYDACRAMRRAGLHDTLIVAITGYGQPSDRALSQQASFDAHLVKPVSFNSILDIIEGSTALNGDTSNFEVRTLNIER